MGKSKSALLLLVQKYVENDPVTAAHVLETMEEKEALRVLKSIPPSLVPGTVGHMNDHFAATLLRKLPDPLFTDIIAKLEFHQASTLFLRLPRRKQVLLLEKLPEKRKREIQDFLTYPQDSAGRIMSVDFLAFHSDLKVKDTIDKIRQLAQQGRTASYAYVIDHGNRLVGVMNMRDMMLAPPDASLESVMRKEVFTVNCFADREQVAGQLSERRYFAAPVIDNDNRLVGVVRADQLINDVQEEATEDIQKMFGAGGDERVFSSVGFSLRKRLPWLHVNLATAFLAAFVVSLFEDIIARITILAVFLPVVAGQGGNAGAQSLAIVMRGLVMREIPRHKAGRLILKEAYLGALNGIVIGVVTAAVAWFWHGNPFLGLVIGMGMLVNLTIASLAGAAIPITMKAIGLDPAQCSNIILTTVTDVAGFGAFLGFAVLFQDFLF